MLVFGFALALFAADAPAAVATTPAPAATTVTVQVSGRVKHPGSIALDSGARLSDALTAAGAFAIETLVARLGGVPVPDTECVPGGERLRYVYLMRATEPSRATTGYAIDIVLVRQHDPRYDLLLKQNDKIFVPDCRPRNRILVPPTFPRSLV